MAIFEGSAKKDESPGKDDDNTGDDVITGKGGTAEGTQVMDDEELTRIVGGTGNDGSNSGTNDDDNSGDTAWFNSPGPSWDP